MHSIISIPKAAMYHMFYTAAERLISLRDKIYHACDIVKAEEDLDCTVSSEQRNSQFEIVSLLPAS